MSRFTTRVELHQAIRDDYMQLHAEMQQRGFTTIIVADDGRRFHLPPAEYNLEGNITLADVLARAKAAARTVKPNAAVVVTEASARSWDGLQQIT
jgi:hypothetical protein